MVEIETVPCNFVELLPVSASALASVLLDCADALRKQIVEIRMCLSELDLVKQTQCADVASQFQWRKIMFQKRLWFCEADVSHKLRLQMIDRVEVGDGSMVDRYVGSFQETPNVRLELLHQIANRINVACGQNRFDLWSGFSPDATTFVFHDKLRVDQSAQ